MRRPGILLLAVIAVIATTGPVAAQPKVTITGFMDTITSYTHNISQTDLNPARNSENEWYARTRIRPDLVAEVGRTKFVLGIEIDSTFGQTGATDGSFGGAGPQRFGTTSGFDQNTDVAGIMEIKWAYTEFAVPLVPVPTILRLGAQPFTATYKTAILATGDFAGAHLSSQLMPGLRGNFTYAQAEEASTGPRDGFIRGDDPIIIASVEITPFKGLDLRPIFSYANFIGVTSGAARQNRAGLGNNAATFQTCPGTAGPGTGACGATGTPRPTAPSRSDSRSAWTRAGGPARSSSSRRCSISSGAAIRRPRLPPTPLARGSSRPCSATRGTLDLRGGWQTGPLLLEAVGIYTTGNSAKDRIDLNRSRLKYYEPISTDGSFFATWSEMMGGGAVDYFNSFRANSASLRPTISIGFDKYGLIVGGLRASYAVTPVFTVRAGAHARWTAEEVDTASTVANATGLTPRCGAAALDCGHVHRPGGRELPWLRDRRRVPVAVRAERHARLRGGVLLRRQRTVLAPDHELHDGRRPETAGTRRTCRRSPLGSATAGEAWVWPPRNGWPRPHRRRERRLERPRVVDDQR